MMGLIRLIRDMDVARLSLGVKGDGQGRVRRESVGARGREMKASTCVAESRYIYTVSKLWVGLRHFFVAAK